jgi:hypothetical protein
VVSGDGSRLFIVEGPVSLTPFGQRCLVAGLLQLKLEDAAPFLLSFHADALRLSRCFDRVMP